MTERDIRPRVTADPAITRRQPGGCMSCRTIDASSVRVRPGLYGSGGRRLCRNGQRIAYEPTAERRDCA